MSADKRSVHTDALATLGTIIDETGKRDAIHLAVEPCIAGESLYPGQDIGIENGIATSKAMKMVGIVDPFLRGDVSKGKRFWLIVYPRTITSLRHVWEHPDFSEEHEELLSQAVTEKITGTSERWLRNFCDNSDCPSYEKVIAAALDVDDDEYLFFNGEDAHGEIPPEFWDHLEKVSGRKLTVRPTHFSCSC